VKRTRTEEDGTFTEFDYRLAPGALNDNGMLTDNIAGEWLRYVQAQHARKFDISTDALQQRNITQEFEVAVARGDTEPKLRESILDAVNGGNGIETMIDIVRYYGMNPDKVVNGDYQRRTRAQYLHQEITFHTKLPELVQDELRGFIVGLAAQESRFNAGLPKNSATAEGVLQLVDAVREENGHDPSTRLSFVQEVGVCGVHFSNVYSRVEHWMKHELIRNANGGIVEQDRPETYQMLRGLFPEGSEGEQSWQKIFFWCHVWSMHTMLGHGLLERVCMNLLQHIPQKSCKQCLVRTQGMTCLLSLPILLKSLKQMNLHKTMEKMHKHISSQLPP